MSEISHQVVRLSRGKHSSPERGVCVMELASMLAGERFSDRPRSVDPVVGAFLRGYNDVLDDVRRQDLYRYAAEAVGTAAGREVQRRRAQRCVAWGEELSPGSRFRLRRWSTRWYFAAAGQFAAREAARRLDAGAHRRALALLDELIALGGPAPGVVLAEELADASAVEYADDA
jgi:hypothetical protein